jgi:hypothetical protein
VPSTVLGFVFAREGNAGAILFGFEIFRLGLFCNYVGQVDILLGQFKFEKLVANLKNSSSFLSSLLIFQCNVNSGC